MVIEPVEDKFHGEHKFNETQRATNQDEFDIEPTITTDDIEQIAGDPYFGLFGTADDGK